MSHGNLPLFGAAAALVVAAPALAEPAGKSLARNAARIVGGTYRVDDERTLVRWRVDRPGGSPQVGTVAQLSGSLTLDPWDPGVARIEIAIPVAKVAKAGPTAAHFVSTSIVPDPARGKARITGDLTLNGLTRPITLDAGFFRAARLPQGKGVREMIGFEARSTIKRSDFGIGDSHPMVSDDIGLEIVAAFTRT